MKKEVIVIAAIKPWNLINAGRFRRSNRNRYRTVIFSKKRQLSFPALERIKPKYVFFPHWSWKIPESIYKNFECVILHMTDLPFGRGGSPLQNLIIRGLKKTKISAIKAVDEVDSGPIYIKRDLSLRGSAEEIYRRASGIIFDDIIPYIIKNNPSPKHQAGRAVVFKRRKPEESVVPRDIDIKHTYDFIRMLDAESYPRAFIEFRKIRFEFLKAERRNGFIEAKVHIKERTRL